jgi:LEA14-like dessication related protein
MKIVSTLALLCTLLAGCATMAGLSESPRVSLVGIEPTDLQLFEQRFRVTLQVQNPNAKAIIIRGLDYEIIVNDKLFAQGVSGKPFTVPAYGESTADVEVVSTLQRVMEQLQELGARGKPSIDYAITGQVSVDGIPIPIPFAYEDTLSLPGLDERRRKDGGGTGKSKTLAI